MVKKKRDDMKKKNKTRIQVITQIAFLSRIYFLYIFISQVYFVVTQRIQHTYLFQHIVEVQKCHKSYDRYFVNSYFVYNVCDVFLMLYSNSNSKKRSYMSFLQ